MNIKRGESTGTKRVNAGSLNTWQAEFKADSILMLVFGPTLDQVSARHDRLSRAKLEELCSIRSVRVCCG